MSTKFSKIYSLWKSKLIFIIEQLSIKKILLYLIYKKNISKKRMIKLIDQIESYVKTKSESEYFSWYTIENDWREINKLLSFLPQKMLTLTSLFPNLTESEIDWVYEMSLPGEALLNKIDKVIHKIRKIVHAWNENAKVLPYGSLVNGFLLKNSSDIDLTIIVKDKLKVHPQEYSEGLLTLLKKYTESVWYIIKTDKLFILNWDDYKGMNVEITFNNITGIVNWEYIRTMAEIDCRFHKLGYYIKYFVKESDMFPKQNKLNSF